jgi:hypothetical protein
MFSVSWKRVEDFLFGLWKDCKYLLFSYLRFTIWVFDLLFSYLRFTILEDPHLWGDCCGRGNNGWKRWGVQKQGFQEMFARL